MNPDPVVKSATSASLGSSLSESHNQSSRGKGFNQRDGSGGDNLGSTNGGMSTISIADSIRRFRALPPRSREERRREEDALEETLSSTQASEFRVQEESMPRLGSSKPKAVSRPGSCIGSRRIAFGQSMPEKENSETDISSEMRKSASWSSRREELESRKKAERLERQKAASAKLTNDHDIVQ